jgi:hypothetical protein
MPHIKRPDGFNDGRDGEALASLEGIRRVAVAAAQVASGEADKGERYPAQGGFALEASEELADEQDLGFG